MKKLSYERKKSYYGYLFISLWAVGFVIFFLFPFITSVRYSLAEVSIQQGYVGLKSCGFDNYKKGRTFQKSIGKENAEKLISLIDEYTKTGPIIMATDCGSWDLKITNKDKTSVSFFGPLIDEIYVREIPISKAIREIIGIDDMFLFDGNYSYEDEDNDE